VTATLTTDAPAYAFGDSPVLDHEIVWARLGTSLTGLSHHLMLTHAPAETVGAVEMARRSYQAIGAQGAGTTNAWHRLSRSLVAEMASGHSTDFRAGNVAAVELHKAAYARYCTAFNN